MLKTIFFDLGNVLVFFSHEKMFRQLAACTGLAVQTIKQMLFEERLQQDYETGRIDSLSIYEHFQKRAPKLFNFNQFITAASDIFTPNTDLWPLVEQLKQIGIRLILLSNTSECHFNNVCAKYPVLDLFDDKILSFQLGFMKPDRRIFLKALSRAGCAPEECFYIDDIPEFIDAAKKVGLDAEVFLGVPPLKKALATRGIIDLA